MLHNFLKGVQLCRVMRPAWAAVAGLFLLACQAQAGTITTQNFDGGGTPFTFSNFIGPAASVVPLGNPGNAAQLTYNGIGNTLNTIAFDLTHPGVFKKVTANFDFRANFTGGFGPADGFSFALLNTSVYGTTGAGPLISEEPNLTGSFGLELDTFNNGGPEDVSGNEIGLHYNNVNINTTDLNPTGFNLVNNAWNHVALTITPGAGGSFVSVTLSPSTGSSNPTVTPYSNFFVPGLIPYESRVAFGARTGGAAEDLLIDNINVSFQPSVIPEPSTLTLLGMGVISLVGYGWRRQRKLLPV